MLRRKPVVLCIDDEYNQLIGYKMLLEETGYRVLAASSATEGLEMFYSHPVDAVILDYRMPGMEGDIVAARMKIINAQIPIMLLSGCQGISKSKLKCIDVAVSKGQSPALLLSTLHALLNGPSFFNRWMAAWQDKSSKTMVPAPESANKKLPS